jgi:hypothetical protein
MFDSEAHPAVVMRALSTGWFRLVRLIAPDATQVPGFGMPDKGTMRENSKWL